MPIGPVYQDLAQWIYARILFQIYKSRPLHEQNRYLGPLDCGAIFANFCRLFGRMKDDDRKVLFFMAQKMAKRKAV
jgi:hypothetical protein